MCRWTLAQAESTELLTKKQEDLHNTYYNNMVMYINNKQGDNESSMSSGLKSKKELFKSRESLYSTMLPVKAGILDTVILRSELIVMCRRPRMMTERIVEPVVSATPAVTHAAAASGPGSSPCSSLCSGS